MTQAQTPQPLWDQLVGEDLSGVVFVRDYLQFEFNPPLVVNAYSARVVISADGKSIAFGETDFANMAVSLIGAVVKEARFEEDLRIVFTSGAEILISLRPEDYRGPEAVQFFGRDAQSCVI